MMKQLFWNEAQQRPRAVWRILIQVVLWLLFLWGVQTIYLLLSREPVTRANLGKASDGFRLLALLGSLFWVGRYVDKRPFSDYGIQLRSKIWWIDFGFGFVMGAILIVSIFILFLLLGWIHIIDLFDAPQGPELFDGLIVVILTLFASTLFEALWIFSFFLRNIAEGFVYLDRLNGRIPVLSALVITLIFFVLVETDSPTANMILVSNLFRAGILLALPVILTQRLGMTVGLALGWSITQISVFGFPGTQTPESAHAIVALVETGPEQWTGGGAGLGTGLMAMIILLIASGVITMWEKRRTGKSIFDGTLAHYHPLNRKIEN